jgi:hypothetical protein
VYEAAYGPKAPGPPTPMPSHAPATPDLSTPGSGTGAPLVSSRSMDFLPQSERPVPAHQSFTESHSRGPQSTMPGMEGRTVKDEQGLIRADELCAWHQSDGREVFA